ncbi:MAG: type II secretion system secretin GspD [bacterium]|nr:type II secretion system secretin GspD [bacterium]
MSRRLPVLLLGALQLAVPAVARGADEATVALNFQDVELPVLARFVSEVTGRNFIVDDRVRGKVTIISPTRITPEEAYLVFQSVLQVKGFTTVPSGGFTKIVPADTARESAVPIGRGRGDEFVTRILVPRQAEVATLVPVLQPLVSKEGVLTAYPDTNRIVVVDGAANVERLAALMDELDGPAGSRHVETASLRHAPAADMADRLRDALVAEGSGATLRVVPDPRTNSLLLVGPPSEVRRARTLVARLDVATPAVASQLHVYRLKYAQADALVRVLSQLLGLPAPPPEPEKARGSLLSRSRSKEIVVPYGYDAGLGEPPLQPPPARAEPVSAGHAGAVPLEAPVRLTADPATNALIVSATSADWQTLRRVVAELDVRRRQVFVEAIIVETTADKLRALGVELQGAASTGAGVGIGQVNLSALGTAVQDPTSLPGLILAAASSQTVRLPNGKEVPAYTALLTALQTDSEINVLSAPNMVTTDNEEAEIVVGRNVPFVASRATSASNLSNLFTTIERHDVGITLRLTPQITADDYVRMTLFEEVSDIDPVPDPAVGDPNLVGPTTTVRSASTVVGARHAQTVVIGGLLADTIRLRDRGVPFMQDIPVLGALFRREERTRVKTNLLVFLTPHVLATDAQLTEHARAQRERMPRLLRDGSIMRGPTWDDPPPPDAGDWPDDTPPTEAP